MTNRALFKVDIQVDFCPGGSLAVPKGDEIIPFINTLPSYDMEIDSSDWHPANHKSFAVCHPGKRAFVDTIHLGGVEVPAWPVHCVARTKGAQTMAQLARKPNWLVHKGMHPDYPNYSPFFVNSQDQQKQGKILDASGKVQPYDSLLEFLQALRITDIDAVGLATDYCLGSFVLDALKYGFAVRVLTKGCRGVNVQPNDVDNAIGAMRQAGAEIVS
jgi:nicotinamidase/pyrazinamidase